MLMDQGAILMMDDSLSLLADSMALLDENLAEGGRLLGRHHVVTNIRNCTNLTNTFSI